MSEVGYSKHFQTDGTLPSFHSLTESACLKGSNNLENTHQLHQSTPHYSCSNEVPSSQLISGQGTNHFQYSSRGSVNSHNAQSNNFDEFNYHRQPTSNCYSYQQYPAQNMFDHRHPHHRGIVIQQHPSGANFSNPPRHEHQHLEPNQHKYLTNQSVGCETNLHHPPVSIFDQTFSTSASYQPQVSTAHTENGLLEAQPAFSCETNPRSRLYRALDTQSSWQTADHYSQENYSHNANSLPVNIVYSSSVPNADDLHSSLGISPGTSKPISRRDNGEKTNMSNSWIVSDKPSVLSSESYLQHNAKVLPAFGSSFLYSEKDYFKTDGYGKLSDKHPARIDKSPPNPFLYHENTKDTGQDKYYNAVSFENDRLQSGSAHAQVTFHNSNTSSGITTSSACKSFPENVSAIDGSETPQVSKKNRKRKKKSKEAIKIPDLQEQNDPFDYPCLSPSFIDSLSSGKCSNANTQPSVVASAVLPSEKQTPISGLKLKNPVKLNNVSMNQGTQHSYSHQNTTKPNNKSLGTSSNSHFSGESIDYNLDRNSYVNFNGENSSTLTHQNLQRDIFSPSKNMSDLYQQQNKDLNYADIPPSYQFSSGITSTHLSNAYEQSYNSRLSLTSRECGTKAEKVWTSNICDDSIHSFKMYERQEIQNSQYPTPPMEVDTKPQSPEPCLSPTFLDSLSSSKTNTGSDFIEAISVPATCVPPCIPTPPNSADPKYLSPSFEENTSKSYQKDRILKIIAMEREKETDTSSVLTFKPKKKKKKRDKTSSQETEVPFVQSSKCPEAISTPITSFPSVPSGQVNPPSQIYQPTLMDNNFTNYASTFPNNHNGNSNYSASSAVFMNSQEMTSHYSYQNDSKIDFPSVETVNQNLPPTHTVNLDQSHDVIAPGDFFQQVKEQVFNNGMNMAGQYYGPSKISLPKNLPLPYSNSFDAYPSFYNENIDMSSSKIALSDLSTQQTNCWMESTPTKGAISQQPVVQDHNYNCQANLTPYSCHEIYSYCKSPLVNSGINALQNSSNLSEKSSHYFEMCEEQTDFNPHLETNVQQKSFSHLDVKHNQIVNKENKSTIPQFPVESRKSIPDEQVTNDLRTSIFANSSGDSYSQGKANDSFNSHCNNVDASPIQKDNHNQFNVNSTKEVPPELSKKKRGRPKQIGKGSKIGKIGIKRKSSSLSSASKLPRKNILYKVNGMESDPNSLKVDSDLIDRLANNMMEVADCTCLGPDYLPSESQEGPYYTQLGAAKDIPGIREMMEQRTGVSGNAIRIEKVIYTGREGKSKEGCPVAKWIIRRSGVEEKYLCIVRKRHGHFCNTAVIVMVIVAWEGIASKQADTLYDFLIRTLPKHGLETDRKCGLNEKKTCACQGVDLLRRGASFSFGCSWSMYYNGCKFARSLMARKFKLKEPSMEGEIDNHLQTLANDVAPLYRRLAPDAFRNQVQFEDQASDCRLGSEKGRPFSGVTAVVDFCCHSHRDGHNMNNGSTVVVNLTKHRGFEKPDDEQYHVLPLYILDQTDEFGSMQAQQDKVKSGALEVLSRYMSEVRTRSAPYRPGKKNKTTPKKVGGFNKKHSKLVKSQSVPVKSQNEDHEENETSCSLANSKSHEAYSDENFNNPLVHVDRNVEHGNDLDNMSYNDLMAQKNRPGFNDLYTRFWDYFYTEGIFPPREWMLENAKTCPSDQVYNSSCHSAHNVFGVSESLRQPSSSDQINDYWSHKQHQQKQQKQQRHRQQSNRQQEHREGPVYNHSSHLPTSRQQSNKSPVTCPISHSGKENSPYLHQESPPFLKASSSPHNVIPCTQVSVSNPSHFTASPSASFSSSFSFSAPSSPLSSSASSFSASPHFSSQVSSISKCSSHVSVTSDAPSAHSNKAVSHCQVSFATSSSISQASENTVNGDIKPFSINQTPASHSTYQNQRYDVHAQSNQSKSIGFNHHDLQSNENHHGYKTSQESSLSPNHLRLAHSCTQISSLPKPTRSDYSVHENISGNQNGHGMTFEQSFPSQFMPINNPNFNVVSHKAFPSDFAPTKSSVDVPHTLKDVVNNSVAPGNSSLKDQAWRNTSRCVTERQKDFESKCVTERQKDFDLCQETTNLTVASNCVKHCESLPSDNPVRRIINQGGEKSAFCNISASEGKSLSTKHPFESENGEYSPITPSYHSVGYEQPQTAMNADLNLDQKPQVFSPKSTDLCNQRDHTLPGYSSPSQSGIYLTQSNIYRTSPVSHQMNSANGTYVGKVYPNGPMPGEKVKVHKSEGFVVPTLGQGPCEPPYQVIDSSVVKVETVDNRNVFEDPAMGGVAIAMCHGAVLFEVAKKELHATTALKEPNRYKPKRISLVFYQHKNLNLSRHGFKEYERKAEERKSVAEQTKVIEEMEARGFFKGELSELASIPGLTNGSFGNVFNFPESKKILFPLRFPRYMDNSTVDQVTPALFACMSIAFPQYMKEAFPNPSLLPRLMNKALPVRMSSSLSDNSLKKNNGDDEKTKGPSKFLIEKLYECGGSPYDIRKFWHPDAQKGYSKTTSSVISRWVHNGANVTGPYNRWIDFPVNEDANKNTSDEKKEDIAPVAASPSCAGSTESEVVSISPQAQILSDVVSDTSLTSSGKSDSMSHSQSSVVSVLPENLKCDLVSPSNIDSEMSECSENLSKLSDTSIFLTDSITFSRTLPCLVPGQFSQSTASKTGSKVALESDFQEKSSWSSDFEKMNTAEPIKRFLDEGSLDSELSESILSLNPSVAQVISQSKGQDNTYADSMKPNPDGIGHLNLNQICSSMPFIDVENSHKRSTGKTMERMNTHKTSQTRSISSNNDIVYLHNTNNSSICVSQSATKPNSINNESRVGVHSIKQNNSILKGANGSEPITSVLYSSAQSEINNFVAQQHTILTNTDLSQLANKSIKYDLLHDEHKQNLTSTSLAHSLSLLNQERPLARDMHTFSTNCLPEQQTRGMRQNRHDFKFSMSETGLCQEQRKSNTLASSCVEEGKPKILSEQSQSEILTIMTRKVCSKDSKLTNVTRDLSSKSTHPEAQSSYPLNEGNFSGSLNSFTEENMKRVKKYGGEKELEIENSFPQSAEPETTNMILTYHSNSQNIEFDDKACVNMAVTQPTVACHKEEPYHYLSLSNDMKRNKLSREDARNQYVELLSGHTQQSFDRDSAGILGIGSKLSKSKVVEGFTHLMVSNTEQLSTKTAASLLHHSDIQSPSPSPALYSRDKLMALETGVVSHTSADVCLDKGTVLRNEELSDIPVKPHLKTRKCQWQAIDGSCADIGDQVTETEVVSSVAPSEKASDENALEGQEKNKQMAHAKSVSTKTACTTPSNDVSLVASALVEHAASLTMPHLSLSMDHHFPQSISFGSQLNETLHFSGINSANAAFDETDNLVCGNAEEKDQIKAHQSMYDFLVSSLPSFPVCNKSLAD